MLLEKHNIRPDHVIGHSSGEIAAAFAAGIIDFRTCLAIAYYRGVAAAHLESSSKQDGAMMAVGADTATIIPLLNSLTSGIATIACYNSPRRLTISGDRVALAELKARLDESGVFCRMLRVRTAYHSDHMYEVVGRYVADLDGVCAASDGQSGRRAIFHSSVTSSTLQPEFLLSPSYWAMNLVCPLQFSGALHSLLDNARSNITSGGPTVLVEIGPHSALRGPIREIIIEQAKASSGAGAVYCQSLQRNDEGPHNLNELLASMVNMGRQIVLLKPAAGDLLTDLPSYHFDLSKCYRHHSRLQDATLSGGSPWNTVLGHHLGSTIGDDLQFRNVFALDDIPWLADHNIDGSIIFPMAGYISAVTEALEYHRLRTGKAACEFVLREVVISKAFLISEEDDNEMFTTLRPSRTETRSANSTDTFDFEILSWTQRAGFVEHCRGLAQLSYSEHGDLVGDVINQSLNSNHRHRLEHRLQTSCCNRISGQQLYHAAAQRGLRYGPAFQGVTNLETGPDGAHGNIQKIDTSRRMPAGFESEMLIHPAWLDAALHVGLCNLGGNQGELDKIQANVPAFLEELHIDLSSIRNHLGRNAEVYVYNLHASAAASSTLADISVVSSAQSVSFVEVRGLRMFQTSEQSRVSGAATSKDVETLNPLTLEWLPHPDFIPSLQSIAAAIGGAEDERSRRQDLERWSLYSMIEALDATPQKPQAFHLSKMYDWISRTTRPEDSGYQNSQWSQWLSASTEERHNFKEAFRRDRADMWYWVHVGSKLPKILREELDPLEVLMQDGLLFNIYEQSSIFQRSFQQLAELVGALKAKSLAPHS